MLNSLKKVLDVHIFRTQLHGEYHRELDVIVFEWALVINYFQTEPDKLSFYSVTMKLHGGFVFLSVVVVSM